MKKLIVHGSKVVKGIVNPDDPRYVQRAEIRAKAFEKELHLMLNYVEAALAKDLFDPYVLDDVKKAILARVRKLSEISQWGQYEDW